MEEIIMSQTIQEENKALVLDAFDTLFNKRDYAAAEKDPDLVVTEVQHLKDWIGTLRDRTIEQPVQSTERNSTMKVALDKGQFGPWALVTGTSSGIGKEFARQIAASGINVVLVARREALLKKAGVELSGRYGVKHRVVVLDLSRENFIEQLASATKISTSALSSPLPSPDLPASSSSMIGSCSGRPCD